MDMNLMNVCLWTLFSFVVTWTTFHVTNRKKKATKLVNMAVEERRDGGPDVIIVGAGVGGCSLAYALAKDGRQVHLIERDLNEPKRIIGEFMQPGGRLLLSKLGLEDCLEGIDAQTVIGIKIYKGDREACASFPVEDNKFPHEPFARTFHNGRFVQKLRQKVSSLSNVKFEEGTVKSLIEENGVVKGVTYKTSADEEVTTFAPLTVVIDGCYSNLRRSVSKNNAEVLSTQFGFISKNCRLENPERFTFVMAKPSYIMFSQISSTEVRCVFELLPGKTPSIANGDMVTFIKNTIAPQIPLKLRKVFLKGINEGSHITMMSTKSMEATLSKKRGVILLGDAFNMRHPSSASGMMVLLSDILILRRLLKPLRNFGDANQISEVIHSFSIIRKPMSATVNTLGHGLSQILIATTDEEKEAMRQSSFDYFSRGNKGTVGLMALIGGMNPRPVSLIYHLGAIALSAMGQLLSPYPSPRGIWRCFRLCVWAATMLIPHFKEEGVSQMLFPAYAAAYYKNYYRTNDL